MAAGLFTDIRIFSVLCNIWLGYLNNISFYKEQAALLSFQVRSDLKGQVKSN